MIFDITASIVTYNNKIDVLQKSVDSFLSIDYKCKLYIVDNSDNDDLNIFDQYDNVEYIKNRKNIGFGAAHNLILNKAPLESKYHIILNPDVYFDKSEITKLYQIMEKTDDVGLIMPKVLYPDGEQQHLCKSIPSAITLFLRRFLPTFLDPLFQKRFDRFELKYLDLERPILAPYLSGCFMFLRSSVVKNIGGFDEKFFLYMEDLDYSRRIAEQYLTLYYPVATIFHAHARSSYGLNKTLLLHIKSALSYFNKWGWLFDSKRGKLNEGINYFVEH